MEDEHAWGHLGESANREPGLDRRVVWVVTGRDDDADAWLRAPPQVREVRQRALGGRQSHRNKVGLQARQHDLRFRVPEAGVELDGPDAVAGQHQAGVEDASKLVSTVGKLEHRRAEDSIHHVLDQGVVNRFRR